MTKRILASFLLVLLVGPATAQTLFDTPCSHLTTDNLGNIYTWHDATLLKYSPTGELLFDFRKPNYGNLTSVDADNSIKIMLFYQESGKIVFLDDKLAPIGNELDLFEHNLTSISNAAIFGNNKITLFDETNQDLYITDLNLKTINKTHCNNDLNIHAVSLQCIPDHSIMLVDSTQGLFFFDRFGTFEHLMPIKGVLSAQQDVDHLYYLQNNTLHIYIRANHEMHTLPYLPADSREFRWAKKWLYLLDGKGKTHRYSE